MKALTRLSISDFKMLDKLKHIAAFSTIAVLFLPMIQQYFNLKDVKPLSGAIEITEKPQLSYTNWVDGSFQTQADSYLKSNYGFQPLFIRLNNQLHYSLFGNIKAMNVIEGEDGYLYEENYIRAYYGLDFLGNDSIRKIVEELNQVRDSLKVSGTELVILLAPGKGSFYPEFLPKDMKKRKVGTTNHEVFKNHLATSKFHILDFKSWFDVLRDEVPYPLFPKAGIHWSKYGEYLAADSLVKYIQANELASVGQITYNGIELSAANKDGDYDIGDGMNLLFELPTFPMAYPDYQFVSTEKEDRVLVISDSYYWGLFNKGMSQKCFGNGQFWFYNEGVYPDSYVQPKSTTDLNYLESLRSYKLVILIATDANLYRFPFGFSQRVIN